MCQPILVKFSIVHVLSATFAIGSQYSCPSINIALTVQDHNFLPACLLASDNHCLNSQQSTFKKIVCQLLPKILMYFRILLYSFGGTFIPSQAVPLFIGFLKLLPYNVLSSPTSFSSSDRKRIFLTRKLFFAFQECCRYFQM